MLIVKKIIDLSFLGKDWENCFITFRHLTVGDLKEISNFQNEKDVLKTTDFMTKFLKVKFIEGKGFDGEKIISLKSEDIEELPFEALEKIISSLANNADSKKKLQSEI